jgi:tetratricopeptide (TPR) repeat protein
MSRKRIAWAAIALATLAAGTIVANAVEQAAGEPPQVVSPLGRRFFGRPDADGAIAKADAALAADLKSVDLLINAARARDAALQYTGAIELYTKVIAAAPNDVRGYRFRGHRYISTRKFDLALKDLEKAAALAPSSFDVAYHLGLAYFLTGQFPAAAKTYQACRDRKTPGTELPAGWRDCAALAAASADIVRPGIIEDAPPAPDIESRIGLSDWMYRSLRRAGRHDEAKRLLDTIPEGLAVKENEAYYRALLFYKGVRTEDQVLPTDALKENTGVTVGYGLANYYFAEGRTDRACALLRRLVEDEAHWNAFGFIGAETELTRVGGPCGRR